MGRRKATASLPFSTVWNYLLFLAISQCGATAQDIERRQRAEEADQLGRRMAMASMYPPHSGAPPPPPPSAYPPAPPPASHPPYAPPPQVCKHHYAYCQQQKKTAQEARSPAAALDTVKLPLPLSPPPTHPRLHPPPYPHKHHRPRCVSVII